MEWKIGEIKQINGEWYQCVEQPKNFDEQRGVCVLCSFSKKGNCELDKCSGQYRSDHKSVIFKKLKKLGEPLEFAKDLKFQRYIVEVMPPFYNGDRRLFFSSPTEDFMYVELKQNKEDMEEKKQKMDKLVTDYTANKITYKEFEESIVELYADKHTKVNKPSLKEFDLEAAKAGKPVCTRDGRKARIVCFDKKNERPIIALVQNNNREDAYYYYTNGMNLINKTPCANDLMMLPEKKEGWVNLYRNEATNFLYTSVDIFDSQKEAFDKACPKDYKATVKIEWEE